jgi:hypothetical protein
VEAFLRRVLPDGGDYVVMTIDPARPGPPRHVNGLRSIPDLVAAAQKLSQSPLHVYYAVGTYNNDRNAPKAKRCLFLDLDGKDFGSKGDAAKQLVLFTRTVGFPLPSIIVDSGRGLHAYWCLDRDLPAAEWRQLAGKLKQRCRDAGFKADPACTDDVARVLRVPGTLNHKDSPPTPCRVIRDDGTVHDPGVLAAKLVSTTASVLDSSVGDDLALPKQTYPEQTLYGSEIAGRCAVMGEAVETGGKDHPEPLWSNLLSLLAFCVDGADMVPIVSGGHPSYDATKCIAKFEYKQKRKAEGLLKPVLCSTFEQSKSSLCAECKFRGQIRTPLVLGRRADAAYLPPGYVLKPTGLYKIKPSLADGEPDKVSLAFPYMISDVDLLTTGAGFMVKAAFSSSHNLIRTEVPLTQYMDQSSELNKALGGAGVIAGQHFFTELKHVMTYWLKKLQDIKDATKSQTTNLGWGSRDGEDVFVAGAHIFHKDGRVDTFTHPETQLLQNYEPTGKRAQWDLAAATVLADGREAIAATVLTAFSAPLMKFTGAAGITFSVSSTASGTGKTTALKLAQAVWGHPVRAMAMLDDTPNSLMKKVGFTNSLPAYWDEVRATKNFDTFIQMIFSLAQGKEKARLTSSVRQQEMGTWDTLCVMATNERLVDHVDQIVKSTDAGRMRVFEVRVPEIPGKASDPKVGRMIATLSNNYGQVGQQYAKFLATHSKTIERLVHSIQDGVAKELGATSSERYWVAFVSCLLAACHLANQLQILAIDYKKLKRWLYAEFLIQRAGVKQVFMTPEATAISALVQYADFHRDQFVVVEWANNKLGHGALLVQPPGKEILGLKSTMDSKLRVKEAHFKTWVHGQLHQSPSVVIDRLLMLGIATRRKAGVTAGIANTTNTRVACIEVDLAHATMAALKDQ